MCPQVDGFIPLDPDSPTDRQAARLAIKVSVLFHNIKKIKVSHFSIHGSTAHMMSQLLEIVATKLVKT